MALDKAEELRKLNELKSSGVLTEEEFGAQKAKILKIGYGPGGSNSEASDKSWTVALILSLIGCDRIYLGYVGLGIFKLVTFGGVGIWWLIDLISVAQNKMPDSQGRMLVK